MARHTLRCSECHELTALYRIEGGRAVCPEHGKEPVDRTAWEGGDE